MDDEDTNCVENDAILKHKVSEVNHTFSADRTSGLNFENIVW